MSLFLTFFQIGMQSFGGGAATFALIHQAVLKNHWMSEDAFLETYVVSQVAPGVNLIKLTVLLGKKLRGWRGMLVATAALVVPTSIVTILLTAGYKQIKDIQLVQAAMRGILPATIGLTLYISISLATPIFKRSLKKGLSYLLFTVAVLIGVVLLIIFTTLSPVVELFISGLLVTLYFGLIKPPVPPLAADKLDEVLP